MVSQDSKQGIQMQGMLESALAVWSKAFREKHREVMGRKIQLRVSQPEHRV